MTKSASIKIGLSSSILACLLAGVVGFAVLCVNTCPDVQSVDYRGGFESVIFEHTQEVHSGWPITYSVTRRICSWSHQTKRRDERTVTLFFGALEFAIDLVWTVSVTYATYAVGRRAINGVRKRQFSLATVFLGVTIASLGAFFSMHYDSKIMTWWCFEKGVPYLPWSGLYRWFGLGSPYDWLFQFSATIRVPVLFGWLCMVWLACSSVMAFVRKHRCTSAVDPGLTESPSPQGSSSIEG